ncbi:MAG: hypothetical protein U1F98_05280 [Verrucomicrobiota bacterium]
MPKWVKMILGILLLPVCAGGVWALWRVMADAGAAETTWVVLLAGAGCWLVIYLLLPRPMWIYVVGHELTHAVWTWMCGGQVRKFKAGSDGGHVVVSKSNFLIALAPYFFPLYAILVAGVYLGGNLAWGWSRYAVWFHLALGAAYAFHVTLTCHILKMRQTDITQQGYLFSAVVILLGNVGVLMVAMPLLTGRTGVWAAFKWWGQCTGEVLHRLGILF